MNIAVVGTGYVGLVSGTCFSQMGANVTCIDVDKKKIQNLQNGIVDIYEPTLDSLINENISAGRLHFDTSLSNVISEVELIFIAVGTPSDKDGSADLKYVLEVAREIGRTINNYVLCVTKSTVPVGTAEKVRAVIQEELNNRRSSISFDVASNPEFLKEGSAVSDFMHPDRVIVGVDSEKAKSLLAKLYRPLMIKNYRLIFTDIPTSEMIKYASNAMLATRISFMNDIANLCELVGADVNLLRQGLGADPRIGRHFLYPGCGYGGSCFPKDVKALINTAKSKGYEMKVLESVEQVNNKQKNIVFEKLLKFYSGNLEDKNVCIWGLSFKPNTNDIREATSIVTINKLLEKGANVMVHDPVAMPNIKNIFGDKIRYFNSMYDATIGADAILLLTEWQQFRMPNWELVLKNMSKPLIIDGRNIYLPSELEEAGFIYQYIGRS